MISLDKKGQSLIMFIIFLPVLLMAFALIIDVGLMYNAKIKGEGLLKTAKKEHIDIEEYFKINKVNVKSVEISQQKNKYCTVVNTTIDSVFGNLIGYKQYDIKITDC